MPHVAADLHAAGRNRTTGPYERDRDVRAPYEAYGSRGGPPPPPERGYGERGAWRGERDKTLKP
jgi:hypothetical protein